MKFFFKFFLACFISVLCFIVMYLIFYPIFSAESLLFPYCMHPFDIVNLYPKLWSIIKLVYCFCFFVISFLSTNTILSYFNFSKLNLKKTSNLSSLPSSSLYVNVGKFFKSDLDFYLCEKALFQNILITGGIGTGKTSGLMYPLVNQLISYNKEKLGMLILDVKGNFYKQVLKYLYDANRGSDLILVGLTSNIKYNPLDKPDLNAIVLANRLKTILELFSPNNSESYWLDKVEQVLAEAIKLCRIYNNGYVTFLELHNLINSTEYYKSKIETLRNIFISGKLSAKEVYNLYSSLNFFQNEFCSLDVRTSSIIRSEITRITGLFVSDYDVQKAFCPKKEEINFSGFKDVLLNKKVVVLNMNIAKYKNLAKIISAYLKLDFQGEVLSQLESGNINPSVFICDEYHEYVTLSDADFFAQSRESKCINIVATQSYTSLLNSLKQEASLKVILQNLTNKFWLRTDDIFTIETIQKQIGKEDKIKTVKNISENAGETNYNFFTNSLTSKKSSISETISSQVHTDFIYDTNFFTQRLENFTCLSFVSDGDKILPPCKLSLVPYFQNDITKNFSKNKII